MLKWTHYPSEQQFDNRYQGCGILTEVFASLSSAPVLPLLRWGVRPGAGPEASTDLRRREYGLVRSLHPRFGPRRFWELAGTPVSW